MIYLSSIIRRAVTACNDNNLVSASEVLRCINVNTLFILHLVNKSSHTEPGLQLGLILLAVAGEAVKS